MPDNTIKSTLTTYVPILRWSRNREAGDNHQGRKHHAVVALRPL